MTSDAPQRPSQTIEGARWLENFADDERATARLLIDSLRIVGIDTFVGRMRKTLISQLEDLDNEHKPALFSLGEHRDPEKKCDGSCDYFTSREHWASEGSAHLADFIVSKSGAPELTSALIDPTLAQMREGATRDVIIVTDALLSGAQAVKFTNALYRNRTFKSWHSYHLVTTKVVAYAVANPARRRVRENSHIDEVVSIEQGLDVRSAPWSDQDRAAVVELCKKYSSSGRRSAFGYRNSGSLVAFAHTLPNNLPLVLTQQHGPGHGPWNPFAQARESGLDLGFLDQVSDHSPEAHLAEFINTHAGRQATRAERALIDSPLTSNAQADLVNMLVAVRRREMRSTGTLASALAIPVDRVKRLLTTAQQMDLVDDKIRPTRAGARLVRNLARRAEHQAKYDPDDDDPYYPQQLR